MTPLLTEDQIRARIEELGSQIRADYGDDPLLLVCVLKGSFLFLADLCRNLGPNVQIEFMRVSSYGDATKSSGEVKIVQDLDQAVEGKNVLIVEDIVDTGTTLAFLREMFEHRQPKSLRVVALLNKAEARTTPVRVEYVGFEIPNAYVVGYGLDAAERFRNLPYVAVLQQGTSS